MIRLFVISIFYYLSGLLVPVLVLLFVALWFILRGDLFQVLPCVILFLCFSVLLALRLPLGEEKANLSPFRTFVRFALIWFCLFSLPLGVWEGLPLVTVALPGIFSYLFLIDTLLILDPYIHLKILIQCEIRYNFRLRGCCTGLCQETYLQTQ